MTENLFDNIINTAQDCVFWKDRDRRFVGVNQAFLDYYGFESADVLIGKNDEEMGWHSDPEPFRQDELRVLAGHSTYKVQGKCMMRGEERDIIASKRPIYDGDEIVGLVGSFLDVTDVVKQESDKGRTQKLYTAEQLRKFPFFDRVLDETPVENVLDPLTGIINRNYLLGFAHSLIDSSTPFTFVILDLDNFKYINDTYGHHAGDIVLTSIACSLVDHFEDFGIVGRFGGDELLLIDPRDITFEAKRRILDGMYDNGRVLRRNIVTDEHDLFVTGTAGCASYPENADSYEQLFATADKMLYLGKSRGRNCYNIYVESEHKNLDIKKIAKQGVYTNMNSIMTRMEMVSGFENRLRSVMALLSSELNISDLYYVGKNRRLHSVVDVSLSEDVSDIDKAMENDLYAESSLEGLASVSPILYETMSRHLIGAILIVRIGLNNETDGYLVCAEPASQRIWQEDECGILYFIAKSIAAHIRLSGETIPD